MSVSAQKIDLALAGEGGFEEGAWNYSSPGPRRPVPRTQWVPKYSSKEQAALFRAQSVALWQSCQPGLQGKSQWSPPRTMQKFQPFPPPHTGPGSEAAPRASGRPPLPPLPAAPACLSAGITLRNSFTRSPEICLAASCPFVLAAKPLPSRPSQGEAEILARSPVAKGRGAPLVPPGEECHAPRCPRPSETRAGARHTP